MGEMCWRGRAAALLPPTSPPHSPFHAHQQDNKDQQEQAEGNGDQDRVDPEPVQLLLRCAWKDPGLHGPPASALPQQWGRHTGGPSWVAMGARHCPWLNWKRRMGKGPIPKPCRTVTTTGW